MASVSIALATYNGGRYVGEQLESLADQRLLPDELVVSDDASTDDTVARIEAFAATAPFPVRVHRNAQRLGYRANFMYAASLCRSELVAFCDQDDIWAPRKLALCVVPFVDPEVLLVYHDALVSDTHGKPITPLEQLPARAVARFLSSRPMDYALGFTQIFRRTLVDLSAFWPLSIDHKEVFRQERMAHDQWFFFLASVFGSIMRVDERLVRYRQHGGNSYGWRAPSRTAAIAQYFSPSFRGRAEEYSALESAADRRAAIMAQMRDTVTDAWQQRAGLAAEKYRRLKTLYAERRRIYGSVRSVERAAAFYAVLKQYGYRSKQDWGFGGKALITDFCLGLPAGYRLSTTQKSPRN
jgi:glycosyltransferase involved in cell wall biosynthesis